MAKFKAKIFFTVSLTAFALATLVLTVFNNNPFQSDTNVFIILYASLFAGLFGIGTLIAVVVSRRLQSEQIGDNFWPMARISVLIASVITVLLVLQGLHILDIWVGIPITIAILMLELFFRGNKYRKNEN